MSQFTELSLTGRVATPDDPDWDQARQAWNLAADPHPAAVGYVEGVDDIVAVIRYAATHELKVLGQATGHGASAGLITQRRRHWLHARRRIGLARPPLRLCL